MAVGSGQPLDRVACGVAHLALQGVQVILLGLGSLDVLLFNHGCRDRFGDLSAAVVQLYLEFGRTETISVRVNRPARGYLEGQRASELVLIQLICDMHSTKAAKRGKDQVSNDSMAEAHVRVAMGSEGPTT